MSARRTLGAAQRLYEMHKALTYPRTDFSALPEDYRNHVDDVLDMLAGGGGEAAMSEADRAEAISEAASQVKVDGLKNQKRHFFTLPKTSIHAKIREIQYAVFETMRKTFDFGHF